MYTKVIDAAKRCKISNAKGHMCGSLPGKLLRGTGKATRAVMGGNALPVEMLTNPALVPVGVAGHNAKIRLLPYLRRVAARRTALGLGLAGIGGLGGTVLGSKIHKAVTGSD